MIDIFKNFFKDKSILITGHTGFIGSWLTIWLNELGANIVGYALPPITDDDNYVAINLEEKIVSMINDIRNYEILYDTVKKFKPEIIFHLAAQPLLRESYKDPKETYDTNVGGTINVFEAFRKTKGCKVLINFTTDKCYENKEWVWGYREIDTLGGYDPYSSSKACSELITSAYRKSFFKSSKSKIVSSVRSGNVIGGGDWQKDRLIPDSMRALRNDEVIKIRNLQHIRPWQYVLEPIRGCLMLALRMWDLNEQYSGAWNFGPDSNSIFTVQNIIEKIIKYCGKGSYKSQSSQKDTEFHESKLLLLDSNKAKKFLGWNPILDIDEIIKFTCDWYMNDNINYDYNVNQIKDYLNNLKI